MVGNSTCGIGATGRSRKAIAPASASARVNSDVATGRLINGAEMFTAPPLKPLPRPLSDTERGAWLPPSLVGKGARGLGLGDGVRSFDVRHYGVADAPLCQPACQTVEGQIHHRRRVEGEQLAQHQAADDRDPQW